MRAFGTFTFDVVEKLFNLTEKKTLPLLTEWLSVTFSHNEHTIYNLHKLKNRLAVKAKIWQEDELKMFFIGPLIEEVDLTTDFFQPFTQRMFSIKMGKKKLAER